MRLTTKLLCGVLTMVMAFGLFGCSPSDNEDKNNDVEIENITDFSKFSTMEQITDRIEVTFDNNSGVPFYFAIENEADIDEIMEKFKPILILPKVSPYLILYIHIYR